MARTLHAVAAGFFLAVALSLALLWVRTLFTDDDIFSFETEQRTGYVTGFEGGIIIYAYAKTGAANHVYRIAFWPFLLISFALAATCLPQRLHRVISLARASRGH